MFDRERIAKPTQLTNQYIKLLHETKGYHLGYFQIVQFHQKRQKFYSTHISDGYFKCKVIFKEKASRQIDIGQIKLFSILYGPITNQGNRIFMVFQELKAWDYPRTVGLIRSWKCQASNIYIHGSSLVVWGNENSVGKKDGFMNSFDEKDNDSDGTQSCCASQIIVRNRKKSTSCQLSQQKTIQPKLKTTQSENSFQSYQNGAFSFGQLNQSTATKINDTNKIQPVESTQSLKQFTQKASQGLNLQPQTEKLNCSLNKTPSRKKQQQNQKNRKLLIVAESQSQNLVSLEKNAPQVLSVEKKKIIYAQSIGQDNAASQQLQQNVAFKSIGKHQRSGRKGGKKQTQNKLKNGGDPPRIDDQQDDDDIFALMRAEVNKIKQRKVQQMIQQSTVEVYKGIKSSSKKNTIFKSNKVVFESVKKSSSIQSKSVFACLMESATSSGQYKSIGRSSIKSSLKYSSIKKQQTVILNNENIEESQNSEQITYQQLLITCSQNIKLDYSNKYIRFMVICSKQVYQGNLCKIVVIAEHYLKKGYECGHIYNFTFSNPQNFQNPFQIGNVYEVSMKNVSLQDKTEQKIYSEVSIKVNLSDSEIRKLDHVEICPAQAINFCFTPIQKIQTIQQGKCINLVGVVYSYKNINNKKKGTGWTNIFTLVNPFSGSHIDFTIFDPQKYIQEPGSPAIIFNAYVKIYQGKKTLNTKYDTLFYFGRETVFENFQSRVVQVHQLRTWLQQGNTISSIIDSSTNYVQVSSLSSIENNSQPNLITPLSRITKISKNFLIISCDKCNRKIFGQFQQGNIAYCQTCGKREKPITQLQVSLQISDNTHSLFVQFNHYDSMNWIGEQQEKVHSFSREVMHKWVRLWLKNNGKYRPLVNKMEIYDQADVAKLKLEEVKRIAQYI